MDTPHYLRFARSVALLTVTSAVGCASQVNTGDGAVPDVQVADTGPSCPTVCPTVQPTNGDPCSVVQSCPYDHTNGLPTECDCMTSDASTCGTFMCYTAVPGPLAPPELATA